MRSLANPLGNLTRSGEVALKVLRDLPGTSVFVFDCELRVVMLTGPAAARHGFKPEEVEGQLLIDIFPAEAFAVLEPHYTAALSGKTSILPYEMSNGRSYEIENTPMRDDDGTIIGGISTSRDVTEGREARRARYEAEALFESAFEGAPIGMALVELDGSIQRVNLALCELTGYAAERLLGYGYRDAVHPDDLSEGLVEPARRTLAGEVRSYVTEKRCLTQGGSALWTRVSVSLVRDEHGTPRHYVAQVEDISERRRGEEELKHRADHDSLTNLKNRHSFESALGRMIADRAPGTPAALLLIDLDDFKSLNDSRGHLAGDRFLRHVADTISSSVRDGDLVARFGGDEFAVLLPGADEAAARDVARGLLETLRQNPLVIDGWHSSVTASIGVIPLVEEVADSESVMHLADEALYEAKALGRDRVSWRED